MLNISAQNGSNLINIPPLNLNSSTQSELESNLPLPGYDTLFKQILQNFLTQQTQQLKSESKQIHSERRVLNKFIQPPNQSCLKLPIEKIQLKDINKQLNTEARTSKECVPVKLEDTIKIEENQDSLASQIRSILADASIPKLKLKSAPVFNIYRDHKQITLKRQNPFTNSEESDGEKTMKKLHLEGSNSKLVDKPQKSAGRAQNKWKNIPGHIMSFIRRGCLSYIKGTKVMNLRCVAETLKDQSDEFKMKFSDFISKYKSSWKTYSSIRRYMEISGDSEINTVFLEIINKFLVQENKEDFDIWQSETRMNDQTKEYSVIARENFLKEFTTRLSF